MVETPKRLDEFRARRSKSYSYVNATFGATTTRDARRETRGNVERTTVGYFRRSSLTSTLLLRSRRKEVSLSERSSLIRTKVQVSRVRKSRRRNYLGTCTRTTDTYSRIDGYVLARTYVRRFNDRFVGSRVGRSAWRFQHVTSALVIAERHLRPPLK